MSKSQPKKEANLIKNKIKTLTFNCMPFQSSDFQSPLAAFFFLFRAQLEGGVGVQAIP